MNPFAAVEETDRYKELAAMPEATDMDTRSMLEGTVYTAGVTIGTKDYSKSCWVFANGTRSRFIENVFEADK